MQAASELYRQLLENAAHTKRHRVFIAGEEYGHDAILAKVETPEIRITQPPLVTGCLFADEKPGVGSCVAKQIDLLLCPRVTPPPMAEIRPETQLVLQDPDTGEITAESEWIPQGVFWFDTRETIDLQDPDRPLGALLIHGYDAMLKLESLYIPADADLTAIPAAMDAMATDIAAKIGVTIDARTQLKAYAVDPPVGYTMREVMSFIAAAHAGNWAMTGTGELQLVPLAGIPAETGYLATEDGDTILFGDVRLIVSDSDTAGKGGDETFVGRSAAALTRGKPLEPYTGVILWWDDENAFRAGDDSGRVLEADCIWATQAMANDVLAAVSGFAYKPYAATGAALDPAAELGDGVTVGGLYSVLASVATTYDARTTSDIAAPGEDEVDSEYPYLTPEKRELQRKLTLGRSYYGVRITRQTGLEVVTQKPDGSTGAKAIYNSEKISMTNANGEDCLFFDATANRFKYVGDVDILGGSMNVNNNFIVDTAGNLTINGNINLSGGTITWGENGPPKGEKGDKGDKGDTGPQGPPGADGSDGNPAAYLRSIGITEITSSGVKSPKIEGGEIWGAEFYGQEFNVYPEGNGVGSFSIYGQFANHLYHVFEISYADTGYSPYVTLDNPIGGTIGIGGSSEEIEFHSAVKFHKGVTGLTQTYVPVWG